MFSLLLPNGRLALAGVMVPQSHVFHRACELTGQNQPEENHADKAFWLLQHSPLPNAASDHHKIIYCAYAKHNGPDAYANPH